MAAGLHGRCASACAELARLPRRAPRAAARRGAGGARARHRRRAARRAPRPRSWSSMLERAGAVRRRQRRAALRLPGVRVDYAEPVGEGHVRCILVGAERRPPQGDRLPLRAKRARPGAARHRAARAARRRARSGSTSMAAASGCACRSTTPPRWGALWPGRLLDFAGRSPYKRAASSPSSRGPGHQLFTLVTRVRIPLGTPMISVALGA